ncbi:hypothetical protein AGMMS49950_04780 [Endomicrobiia bacterium]|nr:hypothetical protein AGMMS49950_04780 [Endomicrobiia bacterium]
MNSTNSSLSRSSNNSQRFIKEKIDFKVSAPVIGLQSYVQPDDKFLATAANATRLDVLKKNIVDNQKVMESWNNIYNTVQSKNQSTKCAFCNNIDNTNFMLFQFHAVTDQNLFSLGTLENIKLGDISKLDRNSATSRDGAASAGVNDTSRMNNGANWGSR